MFNNGEDPSTAGDAEMVRRKLSHDIIGESPSCEWTSYEEYIRTFSFLFFEADTQCSAVTPQEVVKAIDDLATTFSTAHCLGIAGCDENDAGDKGPDDSLVGFGNSSYLEFIEEQTTLMLGQCAKRGEERAPESVEEMTCVFSKSIEILHGMKESMLSI